MVFRLINFLPHFEIPVHHLFCLLPKAYSVNDRSMVLRLRYGDRTMLFPGDLENIGLDAILNSHAPDSFRADILKFPHHGKSDMREAFLAAVSPRFTILTCAGTFKPGIDVCLRFDLPYALTEDGLVRLTTDGQTWLLTLGAP